MIPADTLLWGYAHGYFPMASWRFGRAQWYTADPRGVIDLDEFHVPERLARKVRKGVFNVTVDRRFAEVIRACAARGLKSWISEEIIESYLNLHRLGYAHSLEAWKDGKLAGGLYGVALGGAFFGESMFHRVSDASKVCLVHLVNRLRERGYALLDTQMVTPHMVQFGAKYIPLSEYLERLRGALARQCQFE